MSTDYLCLLDKRARGSEVGGAEGVAMALTEGGPGQGRWREQGSTPPHESIISVLVQLHIVCIGQRNEPTDFTCTTYVHVCRPYVPYCNVFATS